MPVIRLCGILLFFALVAGCSSTPEYQPIEPDTGLLMAAEQALAEANTPQAEKFAPRALDWARQRLSLARDIVYIAAREGRALDDAERARVQRLVESAQLDARLAIIRSRALAASAELAEARQTLRVLSPSTRGAAPMERAQ